jgi:hypothetical protein
MDVRKRQVGPGFRFVRQISMHDERQCNPPKASASRASWQKARAL